MWLLTIQSRLVLISTVLLVNYVNAQYTGDSCTHKVKAAIGICSRLEKCLTAIQDLRKGISPQTCGFEGTSVIVCCLEAATTITTTTKTTKAPATSTIKSSNGQLPVGEKSRQACENYKILGYKKELSPILTGGNDVYELVENCLWEYAGTSAIYKGMETEEAEFPHMALIGYGTYPGNFVWKCDGSLISDKFVLTAAHCLYVKGFGEAKFIRLGEHDYASSSDDVHVQQINIKNRIKHNLYKSPVQYHDIALLELEKPATLNLHVRPICLYTMDPAGRLNGGIITGWGVTKLGKPSNKLLQASVKYFSAERCNLTYSNDIRTLPRGIDPRIQICYEPYENRSDTCQGDSGGPIQIYNKDVYCSYYIFGITSFGKGCGYRNIPGGYVNLHTYIEWIEGIVWP